VDYFDRTLPGLGIRVATSGRKTWILFHRVNGKLQRLTIRDLETDRATYPDLTLARARELAREALRKSSVGRDPAAERREAREQTFGNLARLYVEQHARRKKRSWRDDARMIRRELQAWKDRPVASLRRSEVRDLLEEIVGRGAPVVANRVLALVRKVLNFGLDREWVEANVAAKMARPAVEEARSRVLSTDELRAVWNWLEQSPPKDLEVLAAAHWRLNRAALKLRLLTAQRGGEVASMRWADLDLDSSWWTIPAEHSKNKLPHRVPLSPPALKVLKELRVSLIANEGQIRDDSPLHGARAKDSHELTRRRYVFAGIRGTRQRRRALDGLGIDDIRPHDFRRTAATVMAGAGISRLVIAKVLNHAEKGITAVYDRASYDSEKRLALETWSRRLHELVSTRGGERVRSRKVERGRSAHPRPH